MDEPTQSFTVEILRTYSSDDIASMTSLLGRLSERFANTTIDDATIAIMRDSPHHAQIVARNSEGEIVGIVSLSIVVGAGNGITCWMNDFVVSQDYSGAGIGSALWDACVKWCSDHKATALNFTSKPARVAAHEFYLKRGSQIVDTDFFKTPID